MLGTIDWTCHIFKRAGLYKPYVTTNLADRNKFLSFGKDLYVKTPQQRYDELVNRYPDLFDLFSLKDIASFLKITPTHLSRLRKNKTQPPPNFLIGSLLRLSVCHLYRRSLWRWLPELAVAVDINTFSWKSLISRAKLQPIKIKTLNWIHYDL